MIVLALALAGSSPLATTIDVLLAQPDAYAGKEVQLTGQVDECYNMECSLCPRKPMEIAAAQARCVAISFDRFRGPEKGFGADMDRAFRFADVTVVARFDPSCLPPRGICTDRASLLLDARVEQVLRRRSSREGLWRSRQEMLRPAPAELAVTILAEMRLARGPRSMDWPVRVFVTDHSVELQQAVACVYLGAPGRDSADTDWPASFEAALLAPSATDRFQCRIARQTIKGWRVSPF